MQSRRFSLSPLSKLHALACLKAPATFAFVQLCTSCLAMRRQPDLNLAMDTIYVSHSKQSDPNRFVPVQVRSSGGAISTILGLSFATVVLACMSQCSGTSFFSTFQKILEADLLRLPLPSHLKPFDISFFPTHDISLSVTAF